MATPEGINADDGAQNSIEINDLAHLAVDEHNKKENNLLEFLKVLSAKKQVVGGIMHYIMLEDADGRKNLSIRDQGVSAGGNECQGI